MHLPPRLNSSDLWSVKDNGTRAPSTRPKQKRASSSVKLSRSTEPGQSQVSSLYRTKKAHPSLLWSLPNQRPPVPIWRGFTREESDRLTDAILGLFGLDDLIGCTTQEMNMRPIPHAFHEEAVRAMVALFAEWEPLLLQWVFTRVVPPTQGYDRSTRLGYPFFEVRPDKLSVLLPILHACSLATSRSCRVRTPSITSDYSQSR